MARPPKGTMPESELSSQLLRFGVTKQEADLFILLNRIRNSGAPGVTGRRAADLAKTGRVRAYQILQHLADLGLVQVEPGRPKRYVALTPQVGIRRLVALQESKLTELSLLEAEVADGLLKVPPIRSEAVAEEGKERGSTTLLHGISNIQTVARRAMEGQDLRVVVNEESEDHITTTVRYMPRKPNSARVIFATTNKEQKGFGQAEVEIGGYTYKIKVYHGELPTFVLTKSQCLLFFYTSRRYRRKPLSPMTVATVASDCILVDSPKFVSQMETIFERFWKISE
jgi:sugar-specific transcriptional regulator TrmB